MSVSIPQSMSFEMLSRLPPQSFVVESRVWYPDLNKNEWVLRSGGVSGADANGQVNIHLRAATNEFLLNTDLHLSGTTLASVNVFDGASFPECEVATLARTVVESIGPIISQGSRESFNSGALPLWENNDNNTHSAINILRALCYQDDYISRLPVNTCPGSSILAVSNLGPQDHNSSGLGSGRHGQNIACWNTNDVPSRRAISSSIPFRYDLGFYSSLVNSHSVLPLGLMSSYSINGFNVQFRLNDPDFMVSRVDTVSPTSLMNVTDCRVSGLAIRGKVVKILDPAVMSAVLSLYEKTEMVNIGGVQFPLSLRLNCINYRTYTFPVSQQANYFRLPTTDKSVRGLAWLLHYQRSVIGAQGGLKFIQSPYVPGAIGYEVLGWPLASSGACLRRLNVKVGSEQILDGPVDDITTQTNNVPDFLASECRKLAPCLSPAPYYQEYLKHKKGFSDKLPIFARPDFEYGSSGSPPNFVTQQTSIQCGFVSFQNMDYRESDYSTGFQASGKDLTNIGNIEVEMTWAPPISTGLVGGSQLGYDLTTGGTVSFGWGSNPPTPGLQITFLVPYDVVIETSPSGVMDITNSVL